MSDQPLKKQKLNQQPQRQPVQFPTDLPNQTEADYSASVDTILSGFWQSEKAQMRSLQIGSEQEFKNDNDLPLARIKRIMKSDEDVRMISAEAPIVFAKACELFVLELTIRSYAMSERLASKQFVREDIHEAIRATDTYDFLAGCLDEQLAQPPPPETKKKKKR
ncbi:hypothetical protein ScalyP_jg9371 [Parmales sp. scaly parma]|nr:hypothetical protein ScalyP_jg9371 [Parmales sp. scaly parma]